MKHLERKRINSTRLFWLVIFGIFLYVVLDAIAQILPPHYNPISQAESDLAVGKYGFIMAINFLNRGLLSLGFIFAFISTLSILGVSRTRFRLGIYLIGIWAVGTLLLAFFPTDVPSTPMSWHGAIHFVVAIIAFIAGAFGTLEISRKLGQTKELQKLGRIALPLSTLVILLWLVEFSIPFVSPHLNARIGGLTERLFLGSILLWIGIISDYFVTHTKMLKEAISNKMKS